MDVTIVLARFIITFILTLVFGIERQRWHKPIGFGTFTFVSVGSCALGITAITLYAENPLPLLGSIITGIGFLGAGALIRTSDKIFGFTSAASIWIFAVFGLVIGVGEYVIGMAIYVIVWTIIFIDRLFERKGIGSYQKKITISTNKIIGEDEIERQILTGLKRYKLISIEADKKNNRLTIVLLVEGTKTEINKIPRQLFEQKWFDSCKVE